MSSDGKILNTAANVWAWHTGLGTGREGNVRYDQGVAVVNGVLQTDAAPPPLVEGHDYVWAVWAWDDSGRQVTNSSKEIFFTVDSLNPGCP
jgi:hypothetical protein